MEGRAAVRYRNWVLFTALVGTFLTVVNSSMVNIALPTLSREFNLPLDLLTWVVTGYMLPYAVLMPMFGRLGDVYGRRRLFVLGMIVFLAGGGGAGLTRSFVPLLIARVVQAVGAAAILPNGMALVNAVFPASQRGRTMGIWGGTAAFGAVIGPTVGGYLVEYASWRSIFAVNLPFGILGLLPAILVVQEVLGANREGRFDVLGAVTLTGGMFSLLLAVTWLRAYGIGSARVLGLLALGLVLAGWFYRTERRTAQPMVDLSLFANRRFVAATAGGFIQMFSIYAITLLMPVYLQQSRGYGTADTGLFLVAYSLAQALVSPLGGSLADRYGQRRPAMTGLAIATLSYLLLSRLSLTTPMAVLLLYLGLGGLGMGIITSPLTSAVIEASPGDKVGVSSGLYNMIRFMGSVVSATVLSSLLQARTLQHTARLLPQLGEAAAAQARQSAFGEVYLLVAALTLAGALLMGRLRDARSAATAERSPGV